MSNAITLSEAQRAYHLAQMSSDIALLKDKKTLVGKWARFNDGEVTFNRVVSIFANPVECLNYLEANKIRKGTIAYNAYLACFILDANPQMTDLEAYNIAEALQEDALMILNDGEALNLEYAVAVQEAADEALADQEASDLAGTSAVKLTESIVKRINASKDEWARMRKNGLDVSVVLANIDAQIRALETLKASL